MLLNLAVAARDPGRVGDRGVPPVGRAPGQARRHPTDPGRRCPVRVGRAGRDGRADRGRRARLRGWRRWRRCARPTNAAGDLSCTGFGWPSTGRTSGWRCATRCRRPRTSRQITAALDRLDRGRRTGPWTREILALIASRPAVRAPDLAQSLGRETLRFKTDVRKLKELGLTHSLRRRLRTVGTRTGVPGHGLSRCAGWLRMADRRWVARCRDGSRVICPMPHPRRATGDPS